MTSTSDYDKYCNNNVPDGLIDRSCGNNSDSDIVLVAEEANNLYYIILLIYT